MTDAMMVYAADQPLDPLGDADTASEQKSTKNRAKVGSGRSSSLLYTYGPGSIMDLPQFTIMPAGLDDWEAIWRRRDGVPTIHAPRLLEAVQTMLGSQVSELRPFPWAPKKNFSSKEGDDLGVPARVFPQWMRCTGCDLLGPIVRFTYTNTHPYRTDEARFEHEKCYGRAADKNRKSRRSPAVPARYLIACADGHLDEFPYPWWVHHGNACPKAEFPILKMVDRTGGKGASATIACDSCQARRPMNEAQGEAAQGKLPKCRGRHPHLNAFTAGGCRMPVRLMLVGASNLWFPATQSIVVMPQSAAEAVASRGDALKSALGSDLETFQNQPVVLRALLKKGGSPLADLSDDELAAAVALAMSPAVTDEELEERRRAWDPVDLLVPEWRYLQRDPVGHQHDDPSGLMLSARALDPKLRPEITRVLAVDKLRKVNAVVGFTRIDEMERVSDLTSRLVPMTRDKRPRWAVATEDRGEGIFLQFDEVKVDAWERVVLDTQVWDDHRAAHRRNFVRRYSETAKQVDADERLRPPRYWLLHTFAHVLIREMAMQCGYSAASLSERIYAWTADSGRDPAAGLLICTTASDSDGTLGGLVQLSEPARLELVVTSALERASRCSSDPVCAHRTPSDPEDFLHGAACHCCAMASETSCERANRFLDRRFLLNLPGAVGLGFFD
ncbi:DUF1998 domain-containing protein [Cellulomonas dongxiuzhuiae]|uniref:DUF1998 domain-containing protein n=1 Tax=Cellulomonas dongxiuzhuiae TaxID=2819979 RepID=UPI001AAF0DD1|nr:DUF1998 domain-containing protein [Cellulomonas dongxiuzhuiae]MBO3089430.1 DUF1998 domain-containing protein [Cellulomonas dongxiuzhuiae]